ncbi:MAG TPA: triose-phosphate isomerase [Candidatus Saccharimonadales bacterium]|nr:triose-phosphate isomerase [Candidatus Saccharimonadales bacterium]
MGKKLIIANWKMHFTVGQASLFLHRLQERVPLHRDVEVVLCPNFLAMQSLSLQLDRHKFKLGAQNCYEKDEGAFTGEVSATMLRGLASYIIAGHSERRYILGETDKQIAQKVSAIIRNDITPVLCVGETEIERKHGETRDVLHDQVTTGVAHLTASEIKNMVIAYEPVWAIGTGNYAKPDDVAEAVALIRNQIKALYGAPAAMMVRVLYGGSVDADNAGAYLVTEGVDGLLVGGASLNYDVFSRIVSKAHQVAEQEK